MTEHMGPDFSACAEIVCVLSGPLFAIARGKDRECRGDLVNASPIAQQLSPLGDPTTRALHARRPTRDSVRHHVGEM